MKSPAVVWGIGAGGIALTLLALLWLETRSVPRDPSFLNEPSPPVLVGLEADASPRPIVFTLPPPPPRPEPQASARPEPARTEPVRSAPPVVQPPSPRPQPAPPPAQRTTIPAPAPERTVVTLPPPPHPSTVLIVRRKISLGGRVFQHPTARDARGLPLHWREPVRHFLVLQDSRQRQGPEYVYEIPASVAAQTAIGIYYPASRLAEWRQVSEPTPPEPPPGFPRPGR